jgi:hypothetical protein
MVGGAFCSCVVAARRSPAREIEAVLLNPRPETGV